MSDKTIPAFLTLDVEDWYHANFAQLKGVAIDRKASFNMERAIQSWIELCQEFGAVSTCFVLGDFVRAYPELVKKLSAAGHEMATHGDTHDLVYEMSESQLKAWLKKGIQELEQLTGARVQGFRAPSWSVSKIKNPWYLDALLQQGLKYESSSFPLTGPLSPSLFGDTDLSMELRVEQGIVRVPVPLLQGPFGVRVPFSSGAFLRLFPKALMPWSLKSVERQSGFSVAVLHPRELVSEHPRLPLKGVERWVHYQNLDTVTDKLRVLLSAGSLPGRKRKWISISSSLSPKIA